MPEQTHPPYVDGALVIPRQLQRWLDVNPQNGPLRRTQKFITIPAFDIEHVWNSYSEIVGEYHFEAPNNFSLQIPHDGDTISLGTNYTMCVSYVNSDNTVVRYSLIRGDGDLFYVQLEQYSGQLIKKNFRIEIWNTDQVSCSEVFSTNIYTSVLGNQDYRYGTDSELKQADPLCQGQQSVGSVDVTPPSIDLISWLDAGVDISSALWTDRHASLIYTGNSAGLNLIPPNSASMTAGQVFVGTSLDSQQSVFLNFSYLSTLTDDEIIASSSNDTGDYIIISLFNVIANEDPKSIRVDVSGISTLQVNGLVGEVEYIVCVTTSLANGTTLSVYDASGIVLLGTDNTPIGIDYAGSASMNIGDSGNAGAINVTTRGSLVYSTEITDPDYLLQILQFMGNMLSNNVAMSIPLTWGLCAQPTLNS